MSDRPHIREARCGECGEIFNPVDDDDLIHGARGNGDPCGGRGVMLGAYYLGGVGPRPGLRFVPASSSFAGPAGRSVAAMATDRRGDDDVPVAAGPVPPVVLDAVAAYAAARNGAANVDPPTVDAAVLLRRAIYRQEG